MSLHNLRTVASYNSKLLLRSWLFRLFFLLTFCCITLYQLSFQSSVFESYFSGLISLSSFIPYMNAYLFAILQAIPLLFLAGMFLTKEKRLDSMDAIYYRPESNAEYVVGVILGFVPVFLVMAAISLGMGLLINVFATEAPLDVWLYLFYLCTLIFPALIFVLGFAFFIHSWVRHQALSVLVLLIVMGSLVFFVRDAQEGLFDPLGITLPNVFAEVTGHADMTGYLLQRFCWLFVGFGFMGLTVLMFKRLANRPVNRAKVLGVTLVLMGVGVLFGGSVYFLQREKSVQREVYADVYSKYAKFAKGSIVSHEIDFDQQGTRMSGKSRLVFRNGTEEALPEIVLYLNPSLKVEGVREEGAGLSFERDHQVLRVERKVLPGEQAVLELEYRGKIDERVCYLGVDEKDLYRGLDRSYMSCSYGSRFAFLEDDFTLLVPECLWYPVAVPPVNPDASYDVPKDFTTYTLNVSGFGDKAVISQGACDETGDRVTYRNDMPLHGISLCVGPFVEKSITVDSTMYKLYLFQGHERLLDGFEAVRDTLPVLIREFKSDAEYKLKSSYPYSRLVMVEAPITFASFYRNEKGASEYVQPGIVFLPERGMGFWRDINEEKVSMSSGPYAYLRMQREQSDAELCMELIQRSLNSLLITDSKLEWGSRNVLNRLGLLSFSSGTLEHVPNAYQVTPMFLSHTISVQSKDYPVMNAVLNVVLSPKNGNVIFDEQMEQMVNYLDGHSFKDALYSREMRTGLFYNLLKMKADELLKRLSVKGVSTDSVVAFTRAYFADHAFQGMDFDHYNELFTRRFGVDGKGILDSWYNTDRLPVFWIKDFKMAAVGEEPKPMSEADWTKLLSNHKEGETLVIPGMNSASSCIRFSAFNDGDADGIISVVCEGAISAPVGMSPSIRQWERTERPVVTYNYLIKAKTGRQVTLVADNVSSVSLNMNLALNSPNKLEYNSFENKSYTTDTAQFVRDVDRSYFLPGPGEIIVDNEDEGFELVQPSARFRIRNLFNKESSVRPVRDIIMVAKGGDLESGKGINNEAYGLVNRSFVYMIEGSGARMEWTTGIEREGEYDVYVYVPKAVEVFRYDKIEKGGRFSVKGKASVLMSAVSIGESGESEGPEVNQSYTITNGDEVKEVVVNVGEQGWVLLGRFHLSPGSCKVTLNDTGKKERKDEKEKEYAISGDAIKWVYVGEN